jgi:hypothetical protein
MMLPAENPKPRDHQSTACVVAGVVVAAVTSTDTRLTRPLVNKETGNGIQDFTQSSERDSRSQVAANVHEAVWSKM